MPEKLGVLFIANAGIYQNAPVAGIYQQATHGPVAQVIVIGRIEFLPHYFGHYAKHGAAIKLKITGVDAMQFHELEFAFLQLQCTKAATNQ